MKSAANPGERLVQCPYCGTVQHSADPAKGQVAKCSLCDSTIERHYADSVNRSLAFSLAALMLYFPANIYPIIHLEMWGAVQENTVWSGIVSLAQNDMPGIAIIVLLASIVIPFIKIAGMIGLCLSIKMDAHRKYRTWLYRIIEKTGHWSMLDIFLIAIMIALLKLGELAYAVPRPGLIYFTAMVICTMLASSSFDPKVIWDKKYGRS